MKRFRKHKRGHVAWRKKTRRQLRKAAAKRNHVRPVIVPTPRQEETRRIEPRGAGLSLLRLWSGGS
jgi:hypothetical protein